MNITKLVIYGFGKHENVTIDLTAGAAVIYGPNEAGKTTIQQFIMQTLFGYPAKNQSGRRYEPKAGGKFGGQLHVEDPAYGSVVIERTGETSKGQVMLYFADGRRGGEQELQQLLRNYDKASFEAIFSFSVHELQHLENMTEEELSRTLLASGTTGMDAITALEAKLEKEMARLFKKSGRLPEINQLFEELQQMEKDLKAHRAAAEEYAPAIDRIQVIEARLQGIAKQEEELRDKLRQAAKWQQAKPLYERIAVLEDEQNQLSVEAFPADGRRQMDRLHDRLDETKAKMELLGKQADELRETIEPPEDTTALMRLANRETEWQRMLLNERSQKEELDRLEDAQADVLGLLGMERAEASSADVSLAQEEELAKQVKQAEAEEEAERYALRRIDEEKRQLADAEQELRLFLQDEPTEEERLAAEEWQESDVQSSAERTDGSGRFNLLSTSVLVIGAIAVLYGLLQPNFVVILIGVLLLAAGLGLMFRPVKRASEAAPVGREEVFRKKDAFERVTRFDEQLDRLMEQTEAARRRVTRASESRPDRAARAACAAFFAGLGFPENTGLTTAQELFRKLREYQSLVSKETRLLKERAELKEELVRWHAEAQAALQKEVAVEQLMPEVKASLAAMERRNSERQRTIGQLEELEAAYAEQRALYGQLLDSRSAWFKEARAEDREGFYAFADQWERKQAVTQELGPLQRQLAAIGRVEEPAGWSEAFADVSEQQLQDWHMERQRLLEERAKHRQFLEYLLTDEVYEDNLQQFEAKKAELAELARQWSVYRSLSVAIERMMEELKETKLPHVLAHAECFFEQLTEGNYMGLELTESGTFEALRRDGMRFRIIELSQATKEQAYIALRLALADSLKDSHPFPILMDDAFVHFDRRRREQMINLLTGLQKQHQFIYFTCHDNIKSSWPEAQTLDIATIGRGVHP